MVQFSSRMSQLKGSAIRELLALANKPEVLSFAGGMPAPELFPVDKIKAATDAVLDEQGKIALQYSSTNGFEHFRQQIADRMEAKLNIKTSADNILVTSGSQQGLDYSARVFCDKGDVVIIESPSYLGALNAFKACEPNFVAIPTDGDGMIMEELEKVLATTENVKMIYVIPDFQNPSGALRSIRYVIYRRLRSRSASAVTSQSIGGGVDPAPAVNAVFVVIRASGTGVVGAVRTELHSDPA